MADTMNEDELMMAFYIYESKINESNLILDDIQARYANGSELIHYLEVCEYIGRDGIHDAALRWLKWNKNNG